MEAVIPGSVEPLPPMHTPQNLALGALMSAVPVEDQPKHDDIRQTQSSCSYQRVTVDGLQEVRGPTHAGSTSHSSDTGIAVVVPEARQSSKSTRSTTSGESGAFSSSERIFSKGAVLRRWLSGEADQFIPNKTCVPAVWRWEHRTGFKPFEVASSKRIEQAYLQGRSHVRLKSGKMGATPMEIFFHDMLQHDPTTGNCRRVQREGPFGLLIQTRRLVNGFLRSLETGKPRRELFQEYERRRNELHKDIDKRNYDVTGRYSEAGMSAAIARSTIFILATMLAVVLNTLWIGIDAEYNNDTASTDADPIFIVVENIFCCFFTGELIIRLFAYQKKRYAFRDSWFVFDSILLICMVAETWIVPLVLFLQSGGTSTNATEGLSVLRFARLLRLTRIGRIVKILRVFPEVITLLKGVSAATHIVWITLVLLLLLVYVFGIIFKVQLEKCLPEYFETVPAAMWTILLRGAFLDSVYLLANDILACSPVHAGLFIVFIFLSCFTVLNLLVGILCDVVSQVSKLEKEEAAVSFLKHELLEILESHDKDDDRHIHMNEFELLMRNPEMWGSLQRFGVNVHDLIALKTVLYEDREKLSFAAFLQVVLRLRGGNTATVTDVTELRNFMRQRFETFEAQQISEWGSSNSDDKPPPWALQILERFEELQKGQANLFKDVQEIRQRLQMDDTGVSGIAGVSC